MPTPTIFWNVDTGGDWATTADWSPHRLPNSTDDVKINTAHRHTITHSTGTDTVNTLTVGNDYFTVAGGSLTINSASSFAHLLTVSGGSLRFGGAATAARLSQSGGTVRGAGTLTVIGPATFASTLLETGPGRTVLQGDSTFGGSGNLFGVDGGRTLENQGVFTLTGSGALALGYNPFGASSGGGTLKNDAGATIDLQGDSFITFGSGITSFTNAGTLEKTVGSFSIVAVDTTDNGLITVGTGVLWFQNKITGGGSLAVDTGAALRVAASVASTLSMTFNGGSATLSLSDPASFKATIHAFGIEDTIELEHITASKATLGAGDTLVIKNGTTIIATLQLAGDYTGATFNLASDGSDGTEITVTPGPAHAARFISAMAGLGGDSQGPAPVSVDAHSNPYRPTLSAPRMLHFA